jgi:hypothetical protein
MLRTIVAGTAVAGALTFGAVGIAGATTPSTSSTTPTTAAPSGGQNSGPPPAKCAKLPAVAARVQKAESKLNARLPKVQAREAKLITAGKTKRADALKARVARVQARESKINARLAKAEATCGTTAT